MEKHKNYRGTLIENTVEESGLHTFHNGSNLKIITFEMLFASYIYF